jgi:hypothetical protein
MSVLRANKKYIHQAMGYMYEAKGIQEQQRDIDFGRELLANIREYRIQQAALDIQDQSAEGITSAGMIGARQNLQNQLTQPYQRSVDDAERQEKIADLQRKAQESLSKYKKQAKTARTWGYVTAAAAVVATVLTAGAASPLAAAAWGAVATGGTMALGSMAGADRNWQGGAVRGGITATSAMTTAAGAGFLGGGSGAGTGTGVASKTVSYTLADGGATMTAAAPPSAGWSAQQYLAAGSIMSTIGGAVKDINNYEHKLPVSQGYTGQNYSQYAQSFRGFA